MGLLQSHSNKKTSGLTRNNVRLSNGRLVRTPKSPSFLADYYSNGQISSLEQSVTSLEQQFEELQNDYQEARQNKITQLRNSLSAIDNQLTKLDNLGDRLSAIEDKVNPYLNAEQSAIKSSAEEIKNRMSALYGKVSEKRRELMKMNTRIRNELQNYS